MKFAANCLVLALLRKDTSLLAMLLCPSVIFHKQRPSVFLLRHLESVSGAAWITKSVRCRCMQLIWDIN